MAATENTGEMRAVLEAKLPDRLAVGRCNSLLVHGYAWHPAGRIRGLALLADGRPGRTIAGGMPRPDVYAAQERSADPRGLSYRSGFWGIVDLERRRAPGEVELAVTGRVRGVGRVQATLGTLSVSPAVTGGGNMSTQWESHVPRGPRPVAIVMPTYNPDPGMFEVQVESLRAQTYRRWMCVVCDDASDPEKFGEIERIIGDDARFVIYRGASNLGFYRNYERAMAMVPSSVEFVALADQDDRWYPDKLETLVRALGPDKQLAYSNMRVVHYQGGAYLPLFDTYWEAVERPNEHRRLTSMLIANSVTGAASLFRRSLLSYLLPMPDSPGPCFHDHWLAVTAMSLGDLAFVERPLQDYVLHERNATYEIDISWRYPERFHERCGHPAPESRRERLRQTLVRWRSAYVGEVLHLILFSRVALLRTRGVGPARRSRVLAGAHGLEPGARSRGWLLRRWLVPARWRRSTKGLERMIARGLAWRRVRSLEARLRRHPPPPGLEPGPLTQRPDA